MTEKRFFLMRKFLRKDKFHDKICHRFMDSKETEKTLNRLYGKYSSLKKENEQMKTAFKRKYDYDIAEIVDEVYDGDLEMTEKQIKHKGVILSDKEVNQLLNEQDKQIKELEREKYRLNSKVKRLTDELANCYEKLGW